MLTQKILRNLDDNEAIEFIIKSGNMFSNEEKKKALLLKRRNNTYQTKKFLNNIRKFSRSRSLDSPIRSKRLMTANRPVRNLKREEKELERKLEKKERELERTLNTPNRRSSLESIPLRISRSSLERKERELENKLEQKEIDLERKLNSPRSIPLRRSRSILERERRLNSPRRTPLRRSRSSLERKEKELERKLERKEINLERRLNSPRVTPLRRSRSSLERTPVKNNNKKSFINRLDDKIDNFGDDITRQVNKLPIIGHNKMDYSENFNGLGLGSLYNY